MPGLFVELKLLYLPPQRMKNIFFLGKRELTKGDK
jgi:hypothetical protein